MFSSLVALSSLSDWCICVLAKCISQNGGSVFSSVDQIVEHWCICVPNHRTQHGVQLEVVRRRILALIELSSFPSPTTSLSSVPRPTFVKTYLFLTKVRVCCDFHTIQNDVLVGDKTGCCVRLVGKYIMSRNFWCLLQLFLQVCYFLLRKIEGASNIASDNPPFCPLSMLHCMGKQIPD